MWNQIVNYHSWLSLKVSSYMTFKSGGEITDRTDILQLLKNYAYNVLFLFLWLSSINEGTFSV